MIRGLIEKELRQHGISFGLLLLGIASFTVFMSANRTLVRATGTAVEVFHLMAELGLPLGAFFLADLLIAGEFRNRTQLFLEALPFPRWRMLAVKYVIGAGVTVVALAIPFISAVKLGFDSGGVDVPFALILAAKSSGWVCFAFTAAFAHAFFGRYRIVIAASALFLAILASKAGVPLAEFPPYKLVDERFANERFQMPVRDLEATFVIASCFVALGFALGLVRDASVAATLAERMSTRERLFFTFISIGALVFSGEYFEHEASKARIRLPGAFETNRPAVHVEIASATTLPGKSGTEHLNHLAESTADELQRVADYLGATTMPPLYLVHRADFAASRYETGDIKAKQGVLVRANLLSPDFDFHSFSCWIIRYELSRKTSGRAELEHNAWVLDGFPSYWLDHVESHPGTNSSPVANTAPPIYPSQGLSSNSLLHSWFSIRKQLGEADAARLACSGLQFTAKQYGEKACQAFICSMFQKDQPADARAWLAEVCDPLPHRFKRTTGAKLSDFVSEWSASRNTIATVK